MKQSKMKWKTENAANPLLSCETLRQSALEAFSTHSFSEASLNKIIKNAKLNKGSFYYRFYDKMDLYLSLISFIGEEKLKAIKENDSHAENMDFFSLLQMKIYIGLKFAQMYPQYNAMWKKLLSEERYIRSIIDDEFGGLTNTQVLGLISYAMEKGEIRNDLSKPLVVNIFSSIINGLNATLFPDCNEQENIALAEDAITIIKEGLVNRKNLREL